VEVHGGQYASCREDFVRERVRKESEKDFDGILTVLWRRSGLVETLIYEMI
jgi:hypothetical protein